MDRLAQLRALHADASAQYHKLMTGQAARVYVDQSGERIEYTAVKASSLRAYILDLADQIAALEGGRSGPSGPMFYRF